MIVGDDVKRYRVEGKQLTLEDLSQENDDDDTIVFTKVMFVKGNILQKVSSCSSFLCL